MLATSCYSRDQLEDYLHGSVDDALSDAIESHLVTCPKCEDTLAELDEADDTLVRTLKLRQDSVIAPEPDWVQRVADAAYEGSSSADVEMDETSDQVLGDYVLERVLGRGGMSVVFAARHKHLGREVALKVLLPTNQQHAVSRDRFAREMRAVGVLDHAAIVRATDAGQCDDTLYLVMERVRGVDLNRVSKSLGPLPVAEVCKIGHEIALGLAHAHAKGVVHRDVKPSNVMLDDNANIKILDFGLARMQSGVCDVSLQTTMGQLLGTLDYMAPEQASGGEVGPQADLYALGATLFKLLAGIPPHGRSSELPIIEFLNRLATDEASAIDQFRADVPIELANLIAQLLTSDPSQRPSSANQVAEQLAAFAADANVDSIAVQAIAKLDETVEGEEFSVKATLSQLLAAHRKDDNDPSTTTSGTNQAAGGPRRFGPSDWIGLGLGAISLCGVIWLAIILTLKSEQGEIRIESDLEDVRVEIVDEKDRSDILAVQRGQAATTVSAGRYRIRLASPADGIEITPNNLQVTRGGIVIAKIKQTKTSESKSDPPTATPRMTAALEVVLAETEEQLQAAIDANNTERIRNLRTKLEELRIMSRPVPTEPVYQGRTLGDWIAQMRFEQESKSRELAENNVLRLAEIQPDSQHITLAMEVGARQFEWKSRTIAAQLLYDLSPDGSADNLTKIATHIVDVDRTIADEQLRQLLSGEDRKLRDYALTLCSDLRISIQQGQWPKTFAALRALAATQSESETQDHARQIVLAICEPDASAATHRLDQLDANSLSEDELTLVLYVIHERRFEVDRSRHVELLAQWFDRIEYDPGPYPSYGPLSRFWYQASVGPFIGLDVGNINEKTQNELNQVLTPLITSLQRAVNDAEKSPHDAKLNRAAASKSLSLSTLLREIPLTGSAREQAAKALDQRLDQLIRFRAESDVPPMNTMDSPSSVSSILLLLTGSVPEQLTRDSSGENGWMAKELASARTQLTEHDGVIMFGGRGAFARPGSQRGPTQLASWYPYELLDTLQECLAVMRASQRSSRLSRPRSDRSIMKSLLQQNRHWKVDTRLLIHYLLESEVNATFVSRVIEDEDELRPLLRHPSFRSYVGQSLVRADNPTSLYTLFSTWKLGQAEPKIIQAMLDWLETGDALHVHFAFSQLSDIDKRNDTNRMDTTWVAPILSAIDRLSESSAVNDREISYLLQLGDQAPNAVPVAVRFLDRWLETTDPAEEVDIDDDLVEILNRDLEQVKPLAPKIGKFFEVAADVRRTNLWLLLQSLQDFVNEEVLRK